MGDAMVAGDISKLDRIYADDWAIVNGAGKIVTKQDILAGFKSGTDKLLAYGYNVEPTTPERLLEINRDDLALWRKLVVDAKMTLE